MTTITYIHTTTIYVFQKLCRLGHGGPLESGHAEPAAAPDGNGLLGCHQRVAGCEELASGHAAVLESTAARSGRCLGKFDDTGDGLMDGWYWGWVDDTGDNSTGDDRMIDPWYLGWMWNLGELPENVRNHAGIFQGLWEHRNSAVWQVAASWHPWLEFPEVLWLVVPEGFKNRLLFHHFGGWFERLSYISGRFKKQLIIIIIIIIIIVIIIVIIYLSTNCSANIALLGKLMSNFWPHTQVPKSTSSKIVLVNYFVLFIIISILYWQIYTLSGSSPVCFSNISWPTCFPSYCDSALQGCSGLNRFEACPFWCWNPPSLLPKFVGIKRKKPKEAFPENEAMDLQLLEYLNVGVLKCTHMPGVKQTNGLMAKTRFPLEITKIIKVTP